MKILNRLTALAFFMAAPVFAASPDGEFVACLGKIAPESRIARLSAAAPGGAQAVVSKLFVKRGDAVKAGEPVAELSGLSRAEAEVARAQAALDSARAAADIKILQQKNLIADLEGSYAQNKSVIERTDPPRREREQIDYEQEALLRRIAQAKAMLPLVEAAQKAVVSECAAALEVSKAAAGEYVVRSPIDGRVVEMNIRRGEAVGIDGICEIADTQKMFVDAEVYVSDVPKVKVGDAAEVFGDLLGDKKYSGKVVEISSYVKGNKIFSSDPTDYSNLRVVAVKISLDDSEAFRNYIGSQVNVRIILR